MAKAISKMPPGSAWISREILTNENLSGTDVKVYLGLCSYANAETDETFVKQLRLAEELHVSEKTLIQSLKKLEELDFIRSEMRYKSTGKGRTTKLYKIINKREEDITVEFTGSCENADNIAVNSTVSSNVLAYNITVNKNDLTAEQTVKNSGFDASNKNNLNINKNNLKDSTGEPGNMSKQQSLFSLPSTSNDISPMQILSVIKEGSAKSLKRVDYVLEGAIPETELAELDVCYLYQKLHKEIVGYSVSVNRTVGQARSGQTSMEYMERFRLRYNLSRLQAIKLFPQVLKELRSILEAERVTRDKWPLSIGHLTWTGDCYIEKIMRNIQPKVNEKYVQEPRVADNSIAEEFLYCTVDEVF